MSARSIEVVIDGTPVTVEAGSTVLAAVRLAGVDIPTLCQHDALAPYGACRLCVVEVTRGGRTRVVTACEFPAAAGDVVESGTRRVLRVRRVSLELLAARSPEAEAVRALAREHGIDEPRFPGRDGPPLSRRCILCGLCVRVCDEVIGRSAIGHARRGSSREVSAPFGGPADDCIGCGACSAVCPTHAFTIEDTADERVVRGIDTALPLARCGTCGEAFATEKQIEILRQRADLPDWVADTCPACRRKRFLDEIAP